MKKHILISLELNDVDLKIVQGVGHGTACALNHVSAFSCSQDDDTEIARTLQQRIRASGGNSREVVACIPRRFFILKQMVLPGVMEGELRRMIGLQILGQLPYQAEEVVWDFTILEKLPSGYTRILVMVIATPVLERYTKILSSAGIRPQTLTMSSFGLWGWHRLQESGAAKPDSGVQLLISVDAARTEFCFCDLEHFYFSRSVKGGFGKFDRQAFTQTLKETLEIYTREKLGPDPARGKLISPSLILKEMVQEFCAYLQLFLTWHDPLKDLPEKFNQLSAESVPAETSFAVGIGLLGIGQEQMGNFLPPLSKGFGLRSFFKNFFLLMLVYLSFVMALGVGPYRLKRQWASLQQEMDGLQPSLKAIEDEEVLWRVLQEEQNEEKPVIELIDELYRLTPPDIIYSSLHMDPQGEVILQGISKTSTEVNQFQSNLVGSSLLMNISLQQASKQMSPLGEVTHFSFSGHLISQTP